MVNIHDFRPPGPPGRGDKYLREVANEVRRVFGAVQRELEFETLRLTPGELSELSLILAEFAEDLHNDIGIWRTYENYNREWFGVPLPITEGSGDADTSAVTADRVRHLLWVLFMVMKPELTLRPAHKDLRNLADVTANALASRIAPVPRDSGVKRFLQTPDEHGWEIKKKLVWMGTRSYLFRTACREYLAGEKDETEQDIINRTDDFVCQECTQWSGLGVLDVLAGVLPLTDEQRRFRLMYEAQSRKTVDRVMAKLGLKHPWPNMEYPDHILNCASGIGLYYEPQQGVEIMTGFNDILGGVAKQGRALSEDDADAMRAWIRSHSISPSFVRRIVREHDDASIRAAFLLRDCGKPYALEYLLRRYKGSAFRTVYPNISIVD